MCLSNPDAPHHWLHLHAFHTAEFPASGRFWSQISRLCPEGVGGLVKFQTVRCKKRPINAYVHTNIFTNIQLYATKFGNANEKSLHACVFLLSNSEKLRENIQNNAGKTTLRFGPPMIQMLSMLATCFFRKTTLPCCSVIDLLKYPRWQRPSVFVIFFRVVFQEKSMLSKTHYCYL